MSSKGNRALRKKAYTSKSELIKDILYYNTFVTHWKLDPNTTDINILMKLCNDEEFLYIQSCLKIGKPEEFTQKMHDRFRRFYTDLDRSRMRYRKVLKEVKKLRKVLDYRCGGCRVIPDLINGLNLKQCSRCKKVYYCSAKCQKRTWKKHKKNCTK